MENKNVAWIKGPLPPLAESILMSGLVSNKSTNNNSIIVRSSSTDSLENIRLPQQTPSHSVGNQQKQQSKTHVASPSSVTKKENILNKTDIPKSSFVTPQKRKTISYSSLSQPRNHLEEPKQKNRQNSEIVFAINPKNNLNNTSNGTRSLNIRESFGMSATPTSRHFGNVSIGESTNNIIVELDSNIASANSMELNSPSNSSDQLQIKERMIKIHNYSFNQLILQEKSICSDRAMLLRRLMKFYNSLIDEIPTIKFQIKQEEETFSDTIENLKKEIEEMEQKYRRDESIEKELREEIEQLKEKNKELTEESNKKDLTISSSSFETDYLKGQIAQLQFKLQNKKQRRQMLKKSISQMEEESQTQLSQISSLMKALEEMNQGETGYIQKYHRVSLELEEAKKEIEDLKTQINNVPVIVKCDISVDTADLPPPPKKKGISNQSQLHLLDPSQSPGHQGENKLSSKNINISGEDEYHFDLKKPPEFSFGKPKVMLNPSGSILNMAGRKSFSRKQSTILVNHNMLHPSMSMNIGNKKTKNQTSNKQPPPNFENQTINELFKLNEKRSTAIQTSPRLADTIKVNQDTIDYNNVNFAQEKKQNTDKPEKEKKKKKFNIRTDGKYVFQIEQITFKSPLPDAYKIDMKKVESLPEMLKMIMPILSRPYIGRHPTDLKILDNNVTTQHQIVSNQKPLVWALQLIHNFLLDPYLRSNEHIERSSIEPIFIDWITSRYKLQHLVNQVITDFSSILVSNRAISSILSLFYNILEGQYTISELSFFSTLYSFSNQFTYPSLPKCLEEMTVDSSNYDQFSIHITVASKIFAKCFTAEIADSFLLEKAESIKEKEESPLINYFEFLKESMEFFGEKHKLLYAQSKNLLLICGCSDPLVISYDPFITFMTFLDYNGKDLRKEWKEIKSLSVPVKDDDQDANDGPVQSKAEVDKTQDTVQLKDLMGFLAEKETQFVNLLNMISMNQSVLTLKSFSPVISNLFIDLIKRFMKIKKIQTKFSNEINEKIKDDLEELKTSYLRANIPRILWYYRLILLKVDKYLMKEKGFIPFHPQSKIDVIKQLVEYLDRAESVSFALLSA